MRTNEMPEQVPDPNSPMLCTHFKSDMLQDLFHVSFRISEYGSLSGRVLK